MKLKHISKQSVSGNKREDGNTICFFVILHKMFSERFPTKDSYRTKI